MPRRSLVVIVLGVPSRCFEGSSIHGYGDIHGYGVGCRRFDLRGLLFLRVSFISAIHLKRTTSEIDRDKELPYFLVPLVIISFLLFIYTVGRDYFAHGAFPEGPVFPSLFRFFY